MVSSAAHDEVRSLLDDLERRVDPAHQGRIRERHMRAATWKATDRPPVLISPPWDQRVTQVYPYCEAVEDPAKMMVNELKRGQASVVNWLRVQDDHVLQVRPDHGIGLVGSVFGARVEVVEDNPPWVHPLASDDIESYIRRAVETFDIDRIEELGWVGRVSEALDYMTTVMGDYPRMSSAIAVIMPSLTGSIETAGLLWGSDIFAALIDEPQLVDDLLTAIDEAMVYLHDRYRSWIGRELLPEGFSHQHGSIIRGNLMVRNDSIVMVSPEMYAEQCFGHDKAVLDAAGGGGGAFHSCGRWQAHMRGILAAEQIGSLDFGANQSQMNDMDTVYGWAREYGKHLSLVTATADELRTGSIRERFATGATLHCTVESVEEADELMAAYCAAMGTRE
ncbi:MAG: hypothetical protein CMJ49_05665 [Planctomycetaceae bacterium]|nr:hypothetical protein [Planctomycetaceae bacterium]